MPDDPYYDEDVRWLGVGYASALMIGTRKKEKRPIGFLPWPKPKKKRKPAPVKRSRKPRRSANVNKRRK